MNVIFAGTSSFAERYLNALISSKHNVIGVLTQENESIVRGKVIYNSIKQIAKFHNIPIFCSKLLDIEDVKKLILLLKPDIMIVVSYGLKLPEVILNIPKFGCINVHGSLLPRWRGAAPVQRAIYAGDLKTGVTFIKMNNEIDAGDIISQIECPISPEDTTATLCNKLSILGSKFLLQVMQKIETTNLVLRSQDTSLVTYAKKITKIESKLNWNFCAYQLSRCIRAFNPWPVSYTKTNGQVVKIWKASVLPNTEKYSPGEVIKSNKDGIKISTIGGILNIEIIQIPGRKLISVSELLNTKNKLFTPGEKLT